MGVLITRMKMPKTCRECYDKRGERLDGCPKMSIENAFLRPHEFLSNKSRDEKCPLIEVSDLIEKEIKECVQL